LLCRERDRPSRNWSRRLSTFDLYYCPPTHYIGERRRARTPRSSCFRNEGSRRRTASSTTGGSKWGQAHTPRLNEVRDRTYEPCRKFSWFIPGKDGERPPLLVPETTRTSALEHFLDAAPHRAIDARWFWTQPDGDGAGMHFIDLEDGWLLGHEDLPAPKLIFNHKS